MEILSHNDTNTELKTPLKDALELRAAAIEVDVWLQKDGELLVGHDEHELKSGRTLDTIYLKPIFEKLTDPNDSSLPCHLYLLIHSKTREDPDGARTWLGIDRVLQPLRDRGYLTMFKTDPNRVEEGRITIIATGDVPKYVYQTTAERYCFCDAPLECLHDEKYHQWTSLTAHASFSKIYNDGVYDENYAETFDINLINFEKLKEHIGWAKKKGIKMRYWGLQVFSPENRFKIWDTLRDKNCLDLLNADDLNEAVSYLKGVIGGS